MMSRCRCVKRRLCLNLQVWQAFLFTVIVVALAANMFHEQIHGLQKEVYRQYSSHLDVNRWMTNVYTGCNGSFTAYGHQFAVLENVVIKPGETKFNIPCKSQSLPKYQFDFGKEGSHLSHWMNKIVANEKPDSVNQLEQSKVPYAVAVLRYEYANLYHTMTDWFNVYLVVRLLNLSFHDIQVVLFDTHAKGHLDKTWTTLYGEILLISNITKPVMFKKVIWCVLGYESPINYHGLKSVPYIESFHSFFLRQHGVEKAKSLNCEKLSIMFLWRRDYIAHPLSTGMVSRKIMNEEELIKFFSGKYPKANITGLQLDTLTFQKQVQAIAQTDILISMHGAGLSHILFLPKHAGVVEMFTLYWTKIGMTHFKAMARWRGLAYSSWQNLNPSNELPQFYTYIPPPSLYQHVQNVHDQICGHSLK